MVSKLDGTTFNLTGYDALIYCVIINDAKSLKRLLLIDKYDLDRIGEGRTKSTLLQLAVQQGSLEAMTILLENGADPNVTFDTIPSPLQMAEQKNRKPQLALVLKEYGAE